MLEYCTVYTGDTEVSFQTLLVSWKQSFVRGRTQILTFAKTQIGNKKNHADFTQSWRVVTGHIFLSPLKRRTKAGADMRTHCSQTSELPQDLLQALMNLRVELHLFFQKT